MSQNNRLTEKQHEIFGIELQRMRNKLGELSAELRRCYSKELAELAEEAQKSVDHLRQEMSNLAAKENPGTNSLRSQYIRGNDVMDDIKRKLEHTKHLMSLPIDFVQLEREGLLVKTGDKFVTADLNRLPEHVLHRIQFVEQEGTDTIISLNTRGLKTE
jgi:hypothetical protein